METYTNDQQEPLSQDDITEMLKTGHKDRK